MQILPQGVYFCPQPVDLIEQLSVPDRRRWHGCVMTGPLLVEAVYPRDMPSKASPFPLPCKFGGPRGNLLGGLPAATAAHCHQQLQNSRSPSLNWKLKEGFEPMFNL